jgi:hypothetical protein
MMTIRKRHTSEARRPGGPRWILLVTGVMTALVLGMAPTAGLAKSMPAGFMMHEDAAKRAIVTATHHSPPPKASPPAPTPAPKSHTSAPRPPAPQRQAEAQFRRAQAEARRLLGQPQPRTPTQRLVVAPGVPAFVRTAAATLDAHESQRFRTQAQQARQDRQQAARVNAAFNAHESQRFRTQAQQARRDRQQAARVNAAFNAHESQRFRTQAQQARRDRQQAARANAAFNAHENQRFRTQAQQARQDRRVDPGVLRMRENRLWEQYDITTSGRSGAPELSPWLITQLGIDSQEHKVRFGNHNPAANIRFYNQVKEGGPKDFKNNILKPYAGSGIALFGKRYDYDVPGNILFGYLGRSYGFSEEYLRDGAGLAQLATEKGRTPRWLYAGLSHDPIKLNDPLDTMWLTSPTQWFYPGTQLFDWKKFDDPLDQQAIEVGFRLYESHDLSPANVRRTIEAATLRPVSSPRSGSW